MTPTQEMVSVLFEKDTLEKVKAQFESGAEKIGMESRDMTFRLFKAKFGNINLELLCSDAKGMFFKTIGFYQLESDEFSSSEKLTLTILNEFVKDYKSLTNLTSSNISLKFMSIRESGIIGAFSRETVEQAIEILKEKQSEQHFTHAELQKYDKSLHSNGLKIDVLLAFDGNPQSYLDDAYEVNGAFGIYLINEKGLKLNPTVEHTNNYWKFYEMGLLSAFNGF
ncbi:hypothetical protein F7642_12430 [Tenacibaculum finnmarkense genomovar ulcerans]|uniref:hypothetical protein n=1 Tax=Tenacibaculum TaxID=104267 RepID=UPI00187B4C49|nr:hypothetical protein [Tenacibaculum finnmarkense]MBE7635129.1 hypothetical protein [Tenacibaculum finnmarkense genomovar ulcerans]MCD8431082.1 hypothetical protein [Tenacibaculum finnmarkense genomovar ulcerans]